MEHKTYQSCFSSLLVVCNRKQKMNIRVQMFLLTSLHTYMYADANDREFIASITETCLPLILITLIFNYILKLQREIRF